MKPLPRTEDPLVLRTDLSDQSAWEKIVRQPESLTATLGPPCNSSMTRRARA